VIYNRLKLGMTLGIDATLLYDDPTPDGQLSFSDLESTALQHAVNRGCRRRRSRAPAEPPRALLQPADTPYLFYVLCGEDGHHAFGRPPPSTRPTGPGCDE
jgi:cell division protein YceG involved in septum cleavage